MKSIKLKTDTVSKTGEIIRKIRREKDYTLNELGERLGVSGQTLGELERGETGLSLKRLARLLEALEVEGELIFNIAEGKEEQPNSPEPTLERIRLAEKVVDKITGADDGVVRDIYIYGSTVRATAGPHSDLDLLLILETDKLQKHDWRINFYKQIHDLAFHANIYVSLQVRTYREWENESSTFKEEVLKDGLRIYRRTGKHNRALEAGA